MPQVIDDLIDCVIIIIYFFCCVCIVLKSEREGEELLKILSELSYVGQKTCV